MACPAQNRNSKYLGREEDKERKKGKRKRGREEVGDLFPTPFYCL